MTACCCLFSLAGKSLAQENKLLQSQLETTYGTWRNAMIKKDPRAWSQTTATHRQLHIKNRILSEKRAFPSAVFEVPASPPAIDNLKALRVTQNGATATAVYFGKVDFGVGGQPTDNLLLLHFLNERGRWKYDTADYINLGALPEIRKKLQAGDYSYVQHEDFKASGKTPEMPIAVKGAQYIAKVYVFCPGREVKVKVNRISDHRFQDTKQAEVIIGGAKAGRNDLQFATKLLEGAKGTEPLSIRVYLMSTVPGVKPVKIYEYQVADKGEVKAYGSGTFVIDNKVHNQLLGR
ncbi:hypothetical protein SAMN02745181_0642 [Rubritalea squalenifaciens DSM 18772]|uniref:Uncharacterized protein n=1 Tax=Rubritalea squalenifaciens DSM 18772 TaxID=1123071 RepID=A0A1M6D4D1_9BACT|nr:hypothetical protein [Rubritalea squalenifaciens]SHI68096.1 hypothetical protein SAMN02745181_0642 [Rubritalea squalenifaciens DSM 18772]